MIKSLTELWETCSAFLMDNKVYYICGYPLPPYCADTKVIVHCVNENRYIDYVIYESDLPKITPIKIFCKLKKKIT